MIDVGRFVGIPYVSRGRDRIGCDCFGVVRIVYSEAFGITLPSYADEYIDAAEAAETRKAIAENLTDWAQVAPPKEGDAVVFRLPPHIGIYLEGGNMLHVREGAESCVESLASPIWARRIVGYYRHCTRI